MTAGLFLAHAGVRVAFDTIPQFALFMGKLGFPYPVIVVWIITIVEIVAATLLILGVRVLTACLALGTIALGGMLLIHWRFGWFVGEHGTGGMEYSVALLLLLFLIAVDAVATRRPGERERNLS